VSRLTPAAACLLIGNLLDAVFTLTLLELGLAFEANPLLHCAYDASPMAFVVLKLALAQGALLLAAGSRSDWAFDLVARTGAAVYMGVVGYQLVFIATLPRV
jgi:hypothetical protein